METFDFRGWLAKNEGWLGPGPNWYGNYCGPGPKLDGACRRLRDGRQPPPPIDAIDAACKQHDIDYCQCNTGSMSGVLGFGNGCSDRADRLLVRTLEKLARAGQLSPTQAKAARRIARYFSLHSGVRTMQTDTQDFFRRRPLMPPSSKRNPWDPEQQTDEIIWTGRRDGRVRDREVAGPDAGLAW